MEVTDGKAVDSDEGALRITLGVDSHSEPPAIVLIMGPIEIRMGPEQAEQLAVDLRSFAIELRNGGRVS